MKYVKELTEEEKEELKGKMKSAKSERVRKRAHSILLSNERYSRKEIAKIYKADVDTVTRWLNNWTEKGIEGLSDKARSGRPRSLEPEEEQIVIKALEEDPRSIKKAQAKVVEKANKKVSKWTIKRIAKRAGKKWKRMRKSVKSKRDESDFEEAKEELEVFKSQEENGEIDLVYFDETGFTLVPVVPYAWQPIGETLEIPSASSKRLNVLGFFSLSHSFQYFTVQGKVNSQVVIDVFDQFAQTISGTTLVIIDNASIHTSAKFKDKLAAWALNGLLINYLPTYSPELNLIEILWRFIKYEWLPLSAYNSFNDLKLSLQYVLDNIGSKYLITFA